MIRLYLLRGAVAVALFSHAASAAVPLSSVCLLSPSFVACRCRSPCDRALTVWFFLSLIKSFICMQVAQTLL